MKMSTAATTSHLTGLLILLVAAQCLGQDCSFQPECRPGELYRLAIPCQGKCEYYIECSEGVPSEKKCGKFLWHQNQFDPERLECVRNTNCDWWKALTTTTTATSTTTTSSSTTVLPTSTVPPTPSPSTPATPPDTTTSAALNTTITEATTSVAPPTEPITSTSTPISSTPATAGAPHPLAPLVAATGLALLVALR